MATQSDADEAAVLELLRRERSIKLEDVVGLLPQMSWNQVFQCVDSLSRRGEIILLRHGFDYEIVSASEKSQPVSCSG
jgi:hypothetical protein